MIQPDDHGGSPLQRLRQSGAQLDRAVNAVAATLAELDQGRNDNEILAARYRDFADRMEHEYPTLAGPARTIVGLLGELDLALARLNGRAERFVAVGGRTADIASALARDPS